jgi:hypothetical protein
LLKLFFTGKDPISSTSDLKMIHSGKVLEDAKTFEGEVHRKKKTSCTYQSAHQQQIVHAITTPANVDVKWKITLPSLALRGFHRLQDPLETESHHAFAA